MNYFVKIKNYESEQIRIVDLCKVENVTVYPSDGYYKTHKKGNHVVSFRFPDQENKNNVLSEMNDENIAALEKFLAAISQNDQKFLKCTVNGVPFLPELFDKQ